MEVDDGDYATLRELPIPPITVPNSDDSASEEGKVSHRYTYKLAYIDWLFMLLYSYLIHYTYTSIILAFILYKIKSFAY